MRRMLSLVAALAVAGLLASCAGIPRSGGVNPGRTGAADDEGADVTLIADAPVPGASRQDLLRGFIAAASSPLNNYAVAREYLTPDLKLEWNPDESATLDDPGDRVYSDGSDDGIRVSVTPRAVVDSSGVYSERDSGGSVKRNYSFEKVDGEWRISQAPDGIVLDDALFDTVFDRHTLRFFDPTWRMLVPDVRWFPSGSATATRVVTELLNGPSEWLAQSVTTAFPDGTRLARSSVPVADGSAQVDLSRDALSADSTARKRMKAQLVGSLEGVAGAGMVEMEFDGQPAEVPSLNIREPRVDSRPLVLTDDTFGYYSNGNYETVSGLSDVMQDLHPEAVAISSDNMHAGALKDGTVSSVTAGESAVALDSRRGLIDPTIDDDGFVWTVSSSHPGAVRAYGPEGDRHDVQTSWPEASSIASLQLSRDGTRVVALVETGGSAELLLGGVRRSDDGTPVSIGEPISFPVPDGDPISASWADDSSVAVVCGDDTDSIRLVELGGPSTDLQTVDDVSRIVGSNDADGVRVLTTSGELLERRGSSWQVFLKGVDAVATQTGSPDD